MKGNIILGIGMLALGAIIGDRSQYYQFGRRTERLEFQRGYGSGYNDGVRYFTPTDVISEDVNKDGRADLIIYNKANTKGYSIFIATTNNSFIPFDIYKEQITSKEKTKILELETEINQKERELNLMQKNASADLFGLDGTNMQKGTQKRNLSEWEGNL
jgi:hypothetical protein